MKSNAMRTGFTLAFMLLAGFVALTVTVSAEVDPASPPSARTRSLHVTKECSEYGGVAGSFCTITSSNLNAIKPGSRVVYASAAGDPR